MPETYKAYLYRAGEPLGESSQPLDSIDDARDHGRMSAGNPSGALPDTFEIRDSSGKTIERWIKDGGDWRQFHA